MWNRALKITGSLVLLLWLGSMMISAQSGGPYHISRSNVGSGAESSGAGYRLFSTVGQAEAGVTMSAGDYTLLGGFQGAAATASEDENTIYLPLLLRGAS